MTEPTKIPPFARLEGSTLYFDGEGRMEYYIPEEYFDARSASIQGRYVRLLGSFNYRIFNKAGKPGDIKTFNWPTVFLCKPSDHYKDHDVVLSEGFDPANYRILVFKPGDEIVSDGHTPENIDNTKELLSLHVMTGKIPTSIPYDTLYMYPYNSMNLNGSDFDVHSQLMGLIYSKICRDPDDISKPFRLSKAIDQSMIAYKTLSVKVAAKYISPYAAITSENMDEGIVSSILLSDDITSGKEKHHYSPLERVLTM